MTGLDEWMALRRAHNGGPHRTVGVTVAGQIRFGELQRGDGR